MHKLLILSGAHTRPLFLQEIASANLPGIEITEDPAEADLVFGDPNRIRDALANGGLPHLRWVQATWAGIELLLEAGLRRDYLLTNARGVFGPLMSEYVLGYLLLHERHILQRLASQKSHQWDQAVTGTLRGKTLGLLGVGSIGAHLAADASHFGMRVRGFTLASEDCPQVEKYYHPPQVSAFTYELDYLVCVLPATGGTRHIVDAAFLRGLPPRAILLNAGRGSAIDENALIDALVTGRLAAAVLDVFEQEPLPPAHPFWDTPNLYITSHTAAPSFPADVARVFIDNYRRLHAGQPLLYQVDFNRGY